MAELSVSYLGKILRNPIIAASSDITHSLDKLIDCDRSGAGAVVVKSLFEESVDDDNWDINYKLDRHTEEADYAAYEIEKLYGSKDYLDLIKHAKKELNIPVYASINCTSEKWWANYAKQVQEAGADGIELNMSKVISTSKTSSEQIERIYIETLKNVKQHVKIPVAVKIGPNFTSIPYFVKALQKNGANGVVMFNYYSEPDINLSKMELRSTFKFSEKGDYRNTLRWIGLIYNDVNIDLSATTGIKSHEDVIKMMLAGASTVQLASVLYQEGLGVIEELTRKTSEWLDSRKYASIDGIKGFMAYHNISGDDKYLWTQFLKKRVSENV